MKQPNRERVIERAILIATVARDMEACSEHHALYTSAVYVLERNSEGYCVKGQHIKTLDLLGVYITSTWCLAESIRAPFTENDLRKALADAMKLAKKELRAEDGRVYEAIKEVKDAADNCCMESNILTHIHEHYMQGDEHKLGAAIDEWIDAPLEDGAQLPSAISCLLEETPSEYAALSDILDCYFGRSYAI